MITVGVEQVPTLPDAELARRIASSVSALDAENELCRRFWPRVRSFGLRHLGSEVGAEDLAQRVLLLTLQKLRQGEVHDPDRIASFVLGTARLTARTMRRGHSRVEPVEPEHPAFDLAVVTPADPIDRQQLARCVGELGERERSVIVLTFFDDASAAEVGAALGIDAGHVRVVRHRALARLRDCLAPEEGRLP
ncbi:MAG TPA: sigma-70 family RNA polymerase sigma factor [Polyangiaceae bacterium]